jgi:hypothetical protein
MWSIKETQDQPGRITRKARQGQDKNKPENLEAELKRQVMDEGEFGEGKKDRIRTNEEGG